MSFIAPKDVTDRVARTYRMQRDVADKIDAVAKEIGENQTYVLEHMITFAFNTWKENGNMQMFGK